MFSHLAVNECRVRSAAKTKHNFTEYKGETFKKNEFWVIADEKLPKAQNKWRQQLLKRHD